MKKAVLLTYLLLACLTVFSQTPSWVNTIGGTGSDAARAVRVAPNGNVYVAGRYFGTMDLDPSTATANISSFNGSQDMFLACYSSSGAYQWGFSLGKDDYDEIEALTVDQSSNVIVGGFFRGQNVDFDPSSTGTKLLSCAGFFGGGSSTAGGDGFVAKYSSTGAFQWAFSIGTQYWIEGVNSLAADASGNIYVGGQIKDVCDMDPSSAVANLDANVSGTAFLAKYNSAGAYQWAFNVGLPGNSGTDNLIDDIEIDGNGNVCVVGVFQAGAGCDFDPSPGGTALLTATGSYDAFVAKYSSAGAYIWAFNLHGGAWEQLTGLAIDASNNIYVTGGTSTSSMDLDPSSATAIAFATGASANNIIIAKYNSSGAYVWGKLIGGTGSDIGWELVCTSNRVYFTGYFEGTTNFNPGGTPSANLVSSGSDDVFWASYDLSGNYQCSFNIGSAGTDEGQSMALDALGNFYIAGFFSGANTDFDPGSGTFNRSSNGSTDAFLVKYQPGGASITGSFSAATKKCGPTGDVFLTYTDPALANGVPVTITYTDGTTNYTKTVSNNMPFLLTPKASVTTTYTLSATSAVGCGGSTSGNSITVPMLPAPVANAGRDTSVCENMTVILNGSGGASYEWFPPSGLSNPTIPNPTFTVSGITVLSLAVTDNNGCSDTDDVRITGVPYPTADAGKDTMGCLGDTMTLMGNGGLTYEWVGSNIPILSPKTAMTKTVVTMSGKAFLIATNVYGCRDTDEVNVTLYVPEFKVPGSWDVCSGDSFQLVASGGTSYSWYPTNGLSESNVGNPIIRPTSNIKYYVAISESFCKSSDTFEVDVHVREKPTLDVTKSGDVDCSNGFVMLGVAGANVYEWSPSHTLSNSTTANPTARPTATTVYKVVGTNIYGCKDTGKVTVKFEDLSEAVLVIPQAFTPNGDGKNDCYRVHIKVPYTSFELAIYDRWGKRAFFSEDPKLCWDGTYFGQPAQLGTYYYYMRIKTEACGEVFRKGDIQLIR